MLEFNFTCYINSLTCALCHIYYDFSCLSCVLFYSLALFLYESQPCSWIVIVLKTKMTLVKTWLYISTWLWIKVALNFFFFKQSSAWMWLVIIWWLPCLVILQFNTLAVGKQPPRSCPVYLSLCAWLSWWRREHLKPIQLCLWHRLTKASVKIGVLAAFLPPTNYSGLIQWP